MSKKKIKYPNIVRGGTAIPLGNNNYLMAGRKHEQGGIDVGKDLEVEGGEVMHMGDKDVTVYSALPILNGISPAEAIVRGGDPKQVFKAQEEFKRINKLNDDGTKKAKTGIRKRLSFDEWYNTIPKEINDTTNYNLRRAYELLDDKTLEDWKNGQSHLPSVIELPNGNYEFLKSKNHPTYKKEIDWYNSEEAKDFRDNYLLDDYTEYPTYRKKAKLGKRKIAETGTEYRDRTNNLQASTISTKLIRNEWENLYKQGKVKLTEIPRKYQSYIEANNSDFKKGVTKAINNAGNKLVPLVTSLAFGPGAAIGYMAGEAINAGVNAATKGKKDSFGDIFVDAEEHPIGNLLVDVLNPGYLIGATNSISGFTGGLKENAWRASYQLHNRPSTKALSKLVASELDDVISSASLNYSKIPTAITRRAVATKTSKESTARFHSKEYEKKFIDKLHLFEDYYGYPKSNPKDYDDALKTSLQVLDRHNTFYRGLINPADYSSKVVRHIESVFGKNWRNKMDDVYNYMATNTDNGLWFTPSKRYASGYAGNSGRTMSIRRNYTLGNDPMKWFREADFELYGPTSYPKDNRIYAPYAFTEREIPQTVINRLGLKYDSNYNLLPKSRRRYEQVVNYYNNLVSRGNNELFVSGNGITFSPIEDNLGTLKGLNLQEIKPKFMYSYGGKIYNKDKKYLNMKDKSKYINKAISITINGQPRLQYIPSTGEKSQMKFGGRKQAKLGLEEGISLGMNALTGILGHTMNQRMLNKQKFYDAPIEYTPQKLKTRINIENQLDKMRNTLSDYENSIIKNTSSSKVAQERIRLARMAGIQGYNDLVTDKLNKETELINDDRLNRQKAMYKNIEQYNNYLAAKSEFEGNLLDKRSENTIGLLDNLNMGVQNFINNRQQARQFNNNVILQAITSPNAPIEHLELLDGINPQIIAKLKAAKGIK